MSDHRDQPLLPFDPPLQLVKPLPPAEPQQEVSFEVFANRLFEELARRSAASATAGNRAPEAQFPNTNRTGAVSPDGNTFT